MSPDQNGLAFHGVYGLLQGGVETEGSEPVSGHIPALRRPVQAEGLR
jgi:hypothetical protein